MRHLPALFLLVAAAGCGVEDDPRPASFGYIQAAILAPSCGTAACHSSQNRRNNIVLDEHDAAYQYLVMESGYIMPGNPDESGFLSVILRGDDPDTRMPLDSPLPETDINLIARWIAEGAQDN